MFKKLRSKRYIASFVSLIMILSFITPMDLKVFASEKDVTNIQIVATSDMHGRFMPYDYATGSEDLNGSMAQISTMVKELRSKNENVLLVDNGDTIQDNSSSLFLKDEIHPMVLAMNEMGYDAWNLGNHEFNYGMNTLKTVSSKFNGEVLCGNVFDSAKNPIEKSYTIVEKGGVKIGIIGMVTPHIMKWDSENLKGYTATNPAEEAKKVADELRGQVDIMIGLIHAGIDEEYGNGDSARELAKAVPDLAAIVAGHAHSTIQGEREGDVIITEPYRQANALSVIDIKVTEKDGKKVIENRKDDVKSKVVSVSPKGGNPALVDQDLAAKLKPQHDMAIADAKTVIGELKGGDLAPKSEIKDIPQAQLEPTAMMDLINKVQMFYGNADVSSAALFRDDANMKEGPITKSGTTSIYKFDNSLRVLKVNGKQLKKYMEWSASYYNTFKPGDLTISFNQNVRNYNYDMFRGVKYNIDISKEAGSRIVDLTHMDGTPIKDDEIIKLAVNDYRANTTLLNDQTGLFKGENVEVIYDSFKAMGDDGRIRDLIKKYIVEEKKGIITPEKDENWALTGYKWDDSDRASVVKLINEGKLKIPRSEDGRTPNVRSITTKDLLMLDNDIVDVLSFNDFHGALKSEGKNIGAAKLAGEINRLKAENPNTIVVAAGDLFQGSPMSNLKKGEPVAEFLKLIGLEVSAVGNHEFDWGQDLIPGWSKTGEFDFLATNIYDKATKEPVKWAKPYKIIEKDGKRIAFIGIATPETAYKTKPENVKNLEFKDPVESVNIWAKKIRETEKVDAIIALTHLGASQDSKTKEIIGEAAELAKNANGIDAVISAHSHQYINGTVNDIPVVQARNNGRSLARLSLAFNKDSGKLIKIMNSVEDLYLRKDLVEDPAVKNMYDEYNKDLAPILNEEIATLDTDLTHNRDEGLSVLGQFTTKLMAEAAGVQIGITNGGGIRTPIEKGSITMGKMYEVFPFDNTLVTMKLKGSDLKRVIEHGIMPDGFGWGQFYGIKVYYDKDAKAGERITSMRLLDGTPIDMEKYYTVVTNDFMYDKGDNYDFSGAMDVVDTGEPIRDSMVKIIKSMGHVSFNYEEHLIAGEDTTIDEPGENQGENPVDGLDKDENGTIVVDQNSKTSINKTNLPKTGSIVGASQLITLGSLIVLVGVYLFLNDKYKKKKEDVA
ncbi:5'-nucleotidase C-terminal domain-containing protein [Clostridium algidicarnis]|uniref:5'-nucleotidase C-terminal domain-containing protein n=1 Tax=Clostridium algidicarnis TaxID=37659 RepID=UPI001C0C499A|nr:5'-nucleotidase C-terminal domain-containing protein [Clostridium algidicarnis]MBU3227672.1 5'-nucleotidase C-terminal domain-containing protein [Clostridium algidicarnis]MBU3250921.1 5'-nucleotidase C-terminal domain-containing protein [Clostridium algidicarnis]